MIQRRRYDEEIHLDRTACRNCNHRDSRLDAAAGAEPGARPGEGHQLRQQPETARARLHPVFGGSQRLYGASTRTNPVYAKWQTLILPYVYPGVPVGTDNNAYLQIADGKAKPRGLFKCPSATPTAETIAAQQSNNYGINLYISCISPSDPNYPLGAALKRIKNPSQRFMISDMQDLTNANEPRIMNKNDFGFHHMGGRGAVIGYADGHVSAMNSDGIPAAGWYVYFWGQAVAN